MMNTRCSQKRYGDPMPCYRSSRMHARRSSFGPSSEHVFFKHRRSRVNREENIYTPSRVARMGILMHNTDRVDKLASLLGAMHKLTGLDYTGRNFNSRFTIQKTIYLLKSLGNPIAMQYDFSTYIRGPYSRELADDYYAVAKLRPEPRNGATVSAGDVDLIRAAFARGELFVEAVATMHSVRRSNPGITPEEVINHVRVIKPHLSDKTLGEAWEFLFETGLAK